MKTLLFSNVEGKIDKNANTKFNKYMNDYLIKQNIKDKDLVFINAKGLGSEEYYLKSIINCFKNINIEFVNIYEIDENTNSTSVDKIDFNNSIIFLMGGNPITQYNEIKRLNLIDKIKYFNGLVIGFCAGAINLSKIAIITTDEDFNEPTSYIGIGRVNIIVEPHYNQTESLEELYNRNEEIKSFVNEHKMNIIGLPDESIIIVEDENISIFGNYLEFKYEK